MQRPLHRWFHAGQLRLPGITVVDGDERDAGVEAFGQAADTALVAGHPAAAMDEEDQRCGLRRLRLVEIEHLPLVGAIGNARERRRHALGFGLRFRGGALLTEQLGDLRFDALGPDRVSRRGQVHEVGHLRSVLRAVRIEQGGVDIEVVDHLAVGVILDDVVDRLLSLAQVGVRFVVSRNSTPSSRTLVSGSLSFSLRRMLLMPAAMSAGGVGLDVVGADHQHDQLLASGRRCCRCRAARGCAACGRRRCPR